MSCILLRRCRPRRWRAGSGQCSAVAVVPMTIRLRLYYKFSTARTCELSQPAAAQAEVPPPPPPRSGCSRWRPVARVVDRDCGCCARHFGRSIRTPSVLAHWIRIGHWCAAILPSDTLRHEGIDRRCAPRSQCRGAAGPNAAPRLRHCWRRRGHRTQPCIAKAQSHDATNGTCSRFQASTIVLGHQPLFMCSPAAFDPLHLNPCSQRSLRSTA
eukprot:SAG31_NODE_1958_length_6814_cov_3.386597_6_plen_213_part_00